MVRATIVAIDPGITTGIAIVDLHGNIIKVSSRRDMGRNEVVKAITDMGDPIIVTSDVNPLPRSVRNIAGKVDAEVHHPDISMTVAEKKKVVKEYPDQAKKGHESDALAAAIKTWKSYRPFFMKIEKELDRRGLSKHLDIIAKRLLKGEYDNMSEAIDSLKTKI